MTSSINIRLRLVNKPGTLAQVLSIIAEEGGSLGSIDLVSATYSHVLRDLMVRMSDREHARRLIEVLKNTDKVEVVRVTDRVFLKHMGGKIEITPKRALQDREDLALIYTPGVAQVSEEIAKNSELAYQYTMKGNTVAIVTDGSAVLGLGNIGAQAALPVMEGKAVLFKKFAGVDAVPMCIDVQDPAEIIKTVKTFAPNFGGINLEDIAAPKCFEIEEELKEKLDMPVFHDDQHGTAIVALAGLINALKVTGKELSGAKVVISGAGAAGVAISKILLSVGVRKIIVCDSKGALSRDELPKTNIKKWIAENTNEQCEHGGLRDVIAGADVFIGVSAPNLLSREDILKMNENPVVFALANPIPEVEPQDIYDIAGVIATGRSDYPNQINNVLAFPGVFRGALECHARTINEEMCLAAARALAEVITEEQLSSEYIIPTVFNEKVAPAVAKAVEKAAGETGMSRTYSYEMNEDNKPGF